MQSLPLKVLFLTFIALIILAMADFDVTQAQEPSTIEIAAEIGFEGLYKSDKWVPVYITISNAGPSAEGSLQIVAGDTFDSDQVIYSTPISLPTQSSKRVLQYVHLSDLANQLTVELVDDRERVLASTVTNKLRWMATDDILYGVVGSATSRLDFLEDLKGKRGDAAVAFLNLNELPEVPAAWNSLDVIIFHDVDTGQLSARQLSAMQGWLSTGGQAVVVGGPGWQKTTVAFAELLPVTVAGIESLEDLPGLRTQAGRPFRDPGPYLMTASTLQSGEILLHEDGLPLLAKKEFGRGSVYFLALDPNLAPLLDWEGRDIIWNEIVSRIPPLPAWATGAKNGYSAESAVSSLPALSLPSAGLLFIFLLIYIIVIGPLNYLALKRIHRRELAWLTIPGLVLAFTLIALLAGFRLKGNDIIVNQMSIAYGHIDGDQMRVQSLFGLYSPRRATYDLSLPGEVMIRPFEALYGSLSGAGNIDRVERDADVTVRGIRVDVGDIQPLVADSYQPTPALSGEAYLRTADDDLILELTVENNGPETFENTSVLIGLNAIPLGDLNPGDSVSISEPFSTALTSSFGAGLSTSFAPVGPGTSPLSFNYPTILGSADYYDDRDVFPRWQLLESIVSEYNPSLVTSMPGIATLITWSNTGQLDVDLESSEFVNPATTLYFLEMPFSQTVNGGQRITIPKALLGWQVLGENGVFNAAIDELYLPPGWIEFEYRPWPEYQALIVDELEIVLRIPEDSVTQKLPRIQLWDWQQELWITLEDSNWGKIMIDEPLAYIGPANAVRIRLQNDALEGLTISEVYPSLTGGLDSAE